MNESNKDEIIKFRVTNEEKEIIKNYALAKGISLSDFFRELLTSYENSTSKYNNCIECKYKINLEKDINGIIEKLNKIKK